MVRADTGNHHIALNVRIARRVMVKTQTATAKQLAVCVIRLCLISTRSRHSRSLSVGELKLLMQVTVDHNHIGIHDTRDGYGTGELQPSGVPEQLASPPDRDNQPHQIARPGAVGDAVPVVGGAVVWHIRAGPETVMRG